MVFVTSIAYLHIFNLRKNSRRKIYMQALKTLETCSLNLLWKKFSSLTNRKEYIFLTGIIITNDYLSRDAKKIL